MYDDILVPTDGSEHATLAARHAAELARRFDATVHVLAAVDVQRAAGAFDVGGVDRSFVEPLEQRADDDIEATVAALDGDPAVRTERIRGAPVDVILDYTDEEGIDLIAMGTHGRTGVNRYVAGSVAERVLRRSPVPVLTAKATEDGGVAGYEDVLVPTDGSEAASAAVDHAVAVAAATGATVHAVSVIDVRATAVGQGMRAPTELAEAREEHAEAATAAVAESARAAGVDAETTVLRGNPASEILDYAEAEAIDLIAMGTTGQTGLTRYLLGSTAERVVRHADVPVLAVNAREDVD